MKKNFRRFFFMVLLTTCRFIQGVPRVVRNILEVDGTCRGHKKRLYEYESDFQMRSS